jgi:archaeal type IV pilus assembly protein PilA
VISYLLNTVNSKFLDIGSLMMKSIIKSKKGISPILATLLLIVIAVAAVIVTYAWVMTFTGSTTSQAGAVLTVENVRFFGSSEDRIEIVIRNSGTADATVDTVYVGDSASSLQAQTDVTGEGIVAAGSTLTITVRDFDWDAGDTYYFNVGTEEGINLPFNREA